METNARPEMHALQEELRRQDRELEELRRFAEETPLRLQLGDEIRERMGALAEQMETQTIARTPVRGVAV